jgi:hypothetical protein
MIRTWSIRSIYMRVSSSTVGRCTVIIAALLLVLIGSTELPAQQEFGMVTGVTQFVVKGHPGALIGKPDPNYRAPEPKIAPNEKLFWVRIDKEKGHRLFVTQSDENGMFRIDLPLGNYCVESASRHEVDLKRVPLQRQNDEETLIRILFPSWRLDGKPDIIIEKGQLYRMDVEARILFID